MPDSSGKQDMLPIFIKGRLEFTAQVGQKSLRLEFVNQNLSSFGVNGLPWGTLNSHDHFGQEVMATIHARLTRGTAHPERSQHTEEIRLTTPAKITREFTALGSQMGIRFYFKPDQAKLLNEAIRLHGYFPTEYIRKYPRIPSSPIIETFPLQAIAFPAMSQAPDDPAMAEPPTSTPLPIALSVENLSPNGVLLASDSQQAFDIFPPARLQLILQPRGWFPMPIQALGMVCRVYDEPSETSPNIVRRLGVKFLKLDEPNRLAFMELLKGIIEGYQRTRPAQNSPSGG